MPLYFFDLRNGDQLAPDEEGTELSTMDDVQDEAAYALSDMLRDEVRVTNGHPLARHLTIEVRDDIGPVLEVSFAFAINACSNHPLPQPDSITHDRSLPIRLKSPKQPWRLILARRIAPGAGHPRATAAAGVRAAEGLIRIVLAHPAFVFAD